MGWQGDGMANSRRAKCLEPQVPGEVSQRMTLAIAVMWYAVDWLLTLLTCVSFHAKAFDALLVNKVPDYTQ